MKVFITGASGYCGKEIIRELLAHGHEVRGLSRSDAGVEAVNKAGATGVFGDANDLELIKCEAADADAVIHCAFDHSFTDMPGACAKDKALIEMVCQLYEGTRKVLIYSGGTLSGMGLPIFDEDTVPPVNGHNPRANAEIIAAKYRSKGVRVVGVRLPLVHGGNMNPNNFWMTPINADMRAGCVGMVNGGNNIVSDCHVYDVARLYRAVLENPDAAPIVHAVTAATPYKDLAAAAAAHLKLPIKDMTPEEAPAHYGWFAFFMTLHGPRCDSKKTQARLGWAPREKSLLQAVTDGEPGYYQKF